MIHTRLRAAKLPPVLGCGPHNQHREDDGWGNGLTLATDILPQSLAIFSESRLTSSGRMRDLREPMPLEILWLTCIRFPQSPAHGEAVLIAISISRRFQKYFREKSVAFAPDGTGASTHAIPRQPKGCLGEEYHEGIIVCFVHHPLH